MTINCFLMKIEYMDNLMFRCQMNFEPKMAQSRRMSMMPVPQDEMVSNIDDTYARIPTHIHLNAHTYTQKRLHTYTPTHLHTYSPHTYIIHTYAHLHIICIYIYIYTYIYIYIYIYIYVCVCVCVRVNITSGIISSANDGP